MLRERKKNYCENLFFKVWMWLLSLKTNEENKRESEEKSVLHYIYIYIRREQFYISFYKLISKEFLFYLVV